MQSTFDERNWLAWLVKVRIFILTFLLGIELAVAQFSPWPLPLRPVRQHDPVLVHDFAVLRSPAFVLAGTPAAGHLCRSLTDLFMVSLVIHETGGWDSSLNFLYPAGHHRGQRSAAADVGPAGGRARIYSVRDGSGAELLRRRSFVLHDASRAEGDAGDHLRKPVCLPCRGLSGRLAHCQAASGRCATQRHQRRAGEPAGAA